MEHFKFISELLKRISATYKKYGDNCQIIIDENGGKDYWTINLTFKHVNSQYRDCIVFYLNQEDFEPTIMLKEFDNILKKANLLFES